jgi:hypothetical protein
MELSISYEDVQMSGNKEITTGSVKTVLEAEEKKVIPSHVMQK